MKERISTPEDLPVVTRQTAIALGARRYFTGKPCKRGHIAQRMVSSRECTACEREAFHTNPVRRSKKLAAMEAYRHRQRALARQQHD